MRRSIVSHGVRIRPIAEEAVATPRSVELNKDMNLDNVESLRGFLQAILVQ